MREEGQDLVEYAMIVGLIASAVFFSLSTVTAPLNNLISKGATMLANA
jgi:Flp pilus assembly pilin Flp